jgi:DNA-binding MarR family transcriptional regulator
LQCKPDSLGFQAPKSPPNRGCKTRPKAEIWTGKNGKEALPLAKTTQLNLDRSASHLLHRASQAVADLFAVEIGDSNMTPRQLAILITVAHNEGCNQTQLVKLTGIDRSTVSDIVKRMQLKGLLWRRRTSDDARAYSVKLTEEGRQLVRIAEPLGKRIDARVLDALPPQRRSQFMDALRLIIQQGA